jgi:uncharacterized SAM-binding protein YcdF (DUF218 family)
LIYVADGAMPHTLAYSPLIPPSLFILAAAIGIALAWRRRRLGLWVASIAIGLLYLVATPLAAYWLTASADTLAGRVRAPPSAAQPGAIIVLSADLLHGAEPGRGDTVGPTTLQRLAEAARLQRRLGLPILVSGGWIADARSSLAELMAEALEEDFGLHARWREGRSRNTFENAAFSAAVLRQAGISSALVVTNPWHMARALWAFRAAGYPVVAAPTPGERTLSLSAFAVLPQVPALQDSYFALHELIGLAWYAWRYPAR